ncbi:hypothetical protein HHK36_031571 [Tetracentron sinense]|uniref:Uncharacterized protein n=1 Tax=Tetracentron sinense TaxID=13715 RepID=A0A834Y6W8_TETSI|nr:hypothetical protein HHK36_031571 [Tetracentron sinense]
MKACIIMHNMIVEDERDVYISDFNYNVIEENIIVSHERMVELSQIIQNHRHIRDRGIHSQLQTDLVEHLWKLQGARFAAFWPAPMFLHLYVFFLQLPPMFGVSSSVRFMGLSRVEGDDMSEKDFAALPLNDDLCLLMSSIHFDYLNGTEDSKVHQLDEAVNIFEALKHKRQDHPPLGSMEAEAKCT